MSQNSESAIDPSAVKISPLDSKTKYGVEADQSGRRLSAGEDETIDRSRTAPLGGSGM
jgi:hypothetical protein